jgi:hypothetical protein
MVAIETDTQTITHTELNAVASSGRNLAEILSLNEVGIYDNFFDLGAAFVG